MMMRCCFRPSSLLLTLCLFGLGVVPHVAGQQQEALLWSSTGGGWRAMFADVGFVNVFQQAGIMTSDSTMFTQVATVSGGSWFSTQLFYSKPFYDQTVMAESPEQLEQFVLDWMATYYNISANVDNETLATCDTSELEESENYDPDRDYLSVMRDLCELLVEYDFDWALFIQAMLDAASIDYGDPGFINRIASPEGRIGPMSRSDLLIQAALMPVSRIRDGYPESTTTTALYLGTEPKSQGGSEKLFTVPLSAAFIVEDTVAGFHYGTEDKTPAIQIYKSTTPAEFDWDTWEPFYLYPGDDGNLEIDNNDETIENGDPGTHSGTFRTPYGGSQSTTVIQVASISSAAGGMASPVAPSVYAQTFSIGWVQIEEATVRTVWRVLAGIAAGLGAGLIIGGATYYFGLQFNLCTEQQSAQNAAVVVCLIIGCLVGLLTGFLYGVGSILIPTVYDAGVGGIYKNSTFDKFAICSQWPNTCGELDGQFIDGWFIDNPALVINVGHYQQTNEVNADKTLKVIITNCNEAWNNTFNYAQILQYFNTYFNEDIAPGEYLWAPGYWAPFRSPQIFAEYHDERSLDALLEPIPDSNMTTAILRGTTIENPSFLTKAGQPVEMLLLNLNENITTNVIGQQAVEYYTQPLADMTAHVAGSQELVRRVREFVGITTTGSPTPGPLVDAEVNGEEVINNATQPTEEEEPAAESINSTQSAEGKF